MENIITGIEKVEKEIFDISLKRDVCITELKECYKVLTALKERFTQINYIGFESNQLETIRYLIEENQLNLTIWIKELEKVDCIEEVNKMTKIWGQKEGEFCEQYR